MYEPAVRARGRDLRAARRPTCTRPATAGRFRHVRAPRTPAFNRRRPRRQPALARPAAARADGDPHDRPRLPASGARRAGDRPHDRRARTPRRARGARERAPTSCSAPTTATTWESTACGPGKMTAFDTDIRVPLVIAGPGIRPGMRIDALAENVDLAPTFEAAGRAGRRRRRIDGRSLVPLLDGHRPGAAGGTRCSSSTTVPTSTSRSRLPEPESGNPPSYEAMRLEHAVYVEYVDGEREYYDVATDPYELRNAYADARARRGDASCTAMLMAARGCHGSAELPPRRSAGSVCILDAAEHVRRRCGRSRRGRSRLPARARVGSPSAPIAAPMRVKSSATSWNVS